MFRRRFAARHGGFGRCHQDNDHDEQLVYDSHDEEQFKMSMPLRQAPKDTNLKIVALLGASHFTRRLSELGLGIGSIIQIVQSHRVGPIIVDVAGSRIALGQGMTEKILVKID